MEKYKYISKNISHKDYLEMPSVGSSTVKLYSKSPHSVGGINLQTNAMKLGSALHTMVLEPELFESKFYISNESDKRLKSVKDEIYSCSNSGRDWISFKDGNKILKMNDAIENRSDYARNLLSGGVAESTIEFEYKGVKCKARPDYIKQHGDSYFCSDIKKISPSGGVLSIKEIEMQIGRYGYHIQAAFYLLGLKIVLGVDDIHFVNIFVKEPSSENDNSECVCSIMPQESIDIGMIEVEMGIENIKKYTELPTAEKFISEKQVFEGVINKGMPSIGLPGWYRI